MGAAHARPGRVKRDLVLMETGMRNVSGLRIARWQRSRSLRRINGAIALAST
jgi:hypothetical protein